MNFVVDAFTMTEVTAKSSSADGKPKRDIALCFLITNGVFVSKKISQNSQKYAGYLETGVLERERL